MGELLGGLLLVLLLHGLIASNLSKQAARKNNIPMEMEQFVSRVTSWRFPVQPAWLLKLIQDKYNEVEKSLVITIGE